MSKIQTVYCLLLFLFVLFSMDMIFGNMVRESFRGGGGGGGRGLGGGGLGLGGRGLGGGLGLGGAGLGGAGFGRGAGLGLGAIALRDQQLANVNSAVYTSESDDQPFYYRFPFFSQIY